MTKGICLFIFLILIALLPLRGQNNTYENLQDYWESFVEADDNEKDFRTTSFLNFLKQGIENEESFIDTLSTLEGWQRIDINDQYSLLASYVAFEYRPDRIYYCLCSKSNGKAHVFVKESHVKLEQNGAELSLKENKNKHIVSVSMNHEKEVLLNIPDIKTALLVRELSRQRGGELAFEVSDSLENRLFKLLSDESLFENDFSDFEGLSTLISSDGQVKVVTWNVEETMGDHHCFGVMAIRNEENEEINVHRLQDKRNEVSTPEFAVLNPSKWFGAVYYQMLAQKYKGDMYYVLLGYNGNDAFSKLRIVDVLTLSKRGAPRFGASIFDIKGRTKRRLVYEYSNQANMMLRYDAKEDLIVLDHLAPMEPMYEGDRSYYGPDFSYDALEFKKGKWVLIENVELRNR